MIKEAYAKGFESALEKVGFRKTTFGGSAELAVSRMDTPVLNKSVSNIGGNLSTKPINRDLSLARGSATPKLPQVGK